jgi:hypothetical protein
MSSVRLVETTLLVIAGLLLAVATVNDVVRQTHINGRLSADLRTWRAHTGHDYGNLAVDQELLGEGSQREVVCGNTSPGAPRTKTQLCLEIWGPVHDGRRSVHGGWYLPPHLEDERIYRYDCFGQSAQGKCPPPAPHAGASAGATAGASAAAERRSPGSGG